MINLACCSSSSSKKIKRDLIPQELCEEILTRLPVKSLSRFKCVSKPWLSLISSPRFVKAHLLYCSTNFPRIMFLCGKYPAVYLKHCSAASLFSDKVLVDYPETHLPERPRLGYVIGSCNGLVCLIVGHDMFIWNPCTKLYKKMPPFVMIDGMDDDDDDDWQFGDNAFVYNAVDDDYKVMRLYFTTGELLVNIYSLKANSWTARVSTNENISPSARTMLFDGKIVMANDLDGEEDPTILFDIISWDLETEVYSTFEEPDYGEGVEALAMRELGGLFCVVCRKGTHADLWVMKEYGVKESWTKMLTVEYPYYKYKYPNPFFVLPSGEILVCYRARSSRYEVYNPKDKSTRVLNICKTERLIGAHLYVESLVSPTQHDMMGGQEDH